VNFSGVYYNSVQYTTGKDGWLDYDALERQVKEEKPRLIFVGATAYPRLFDYARLKKIAETVDAYLVADISHVAGLIVAGVHPSPVGFADVITTTTHKTLRGPRGAMILCNGESSDPLRSPPEKSRKYLPTMIDRAVFPGLQGGPHDHQTAAIAVALKEAATPEFKLYGQQIVTNAKALAEHLMAFGFTLVTGGTENHLILIDLQNKNVSGKEAETALDAAGITVNKNTIPFDTRKPYDPSGIRMGTPTLTSRGMKEKEMKQIASWISEAIEHRTNLERLVKIKNEVEEFTKSFPLYPNL
jgi:glycine hydroxymethyltransferase